MTTQADDAWVRAAQAVLGGIFLDNECFDGIAATLAPEDMPTLETRLVFQAMKAVRAADAEAPLDAITVFSALEELGATPPNGQVELEYLITLGESVLTAVNVGHHVGIVSSYAARDRIVAIGTQVAFSGSRMPVEQVAEYADRVAGELLAAVASRRPASSRVGMKGLLKAAVDVTRTRQAAGGGLLGPTTGFRSLDEMLLGWPGGCLACLGGPTGKGKTALAFNFAVKGAQARSHHVMSFILEMDRVAIGHRILAAESMIDGNALRAGRLQADDTSALLMAAHRLVELDPYFSVVDEPTMTVADIKAEALDYERQRQTAIRIRDSWRASHPEAAEGDGPKVPPPLGLIIVDYLQLVSMPDAETRERAVAQTSKQLCALARLLNCTILALVQLNDLGAIRESKAPEHDSTIVMTLSFDEDQDDSTMMANCNLNVRKHRHGPVGKIPMIFDKRRQRFGEINRSER